MPQRACVASFYFSAFDDLRFPHRALLWSYVAIMDGGDSRHWNGARAVFGIYAGFKRHHYGCVGHCDHDFCVLGARSEKTSISVKLARCRNAIASWAAEWRERRPPKRSAHGIPKARFF